MSTNSGYRTEATRDIITDVNDRLTWSKKKAYDFKWVERIADHYDYIRGDYRNHELYEKLKTNYDLFAGRGKDAMAEYHNSYGIDLEMEGLRGGFDDIQHIPVINQIARAMIGEQQRRALSAVAVDSSKYNMNVRKMRRNKLLQNYIQQTMIMPIQQEAFQNVMRRLNISDPYQLNPDEQMEFQNMVQQEAQAMTPDEIANYMRKDYKSPSETQAQRILDYLIQDTNVKYLTDECFKHMIVSGKEVVRIYKSHGRAKIEVVNPMTFDYDASDNTHFIEEGDWAKYEQYIKFQDLFNRLGEKIGTKEMRKLEGELLSYDGQDAARRYAPGGWTSAQATNDAKLVATIARRDHDGQFFANAPDIRTTEGQNWVRGLYQRFGCSHDNYDSIRHCHIVFKALRKFKYVTRMINDKRRGFWLDESYTFNPTRGDIKEEIVWIPQVWECDKFGTSDAIYVNKRPIEDQYKSIENPWDVKLPYIGIEFNRMFRNSKEVAPMDFGKPWQYLINIEFAKIQELNATDLGKILVTTMGGIPKDWDLGKFHAFMKYGKMALLDTQQEGFNPGIDTNVLKGIDLGNTPEMLGRVNYLQFLFQQMTISMSYNQSRMGQNEKYMAVSNAQQNIVQSSFQTEDIYNTHNIFLENVLNYLVRVGKSALKENETLRTYLLDDMSIAELEVDWTVMDHAELGVKVRNSSLDWERIQQVKALSQAMVQNGLITMPELIKIIYSNNGADILNAAEFAQQNAEMRQQQQMQQQQEMMQQQQQLAMQLEEVRQQMRMQEMVLKGEIDYKKDIDREVIASTRFKQQYDVNKNDIDDRKELKEREMQLKRQIREMELQLEAIQKDKDRDLEREKLQLKREEMRTNERLKKEELRKKGNSQ